MDVPEQLLTYLKVNPASTFDVVHGQWQGLLGFWRSTWSYFLLCRSIQLSQSDSHILATVSQELRPVMAGAATSQRTIVIPTMASGAARLSLYRALALHLVVLLLELPPVLLPQRRIPATHQHRQTFSYQREFSIDNLLVRILAKHGCSGKASSSEQRRPEQP